MKKKMHRWCGKNGVAMTYTHTHSVWRRQTDQNDVRWLNMRSTPTGIEPIQSLMIIPDVKTNHPCQVWCRSVQGFLIPGGLEIGVFHWQGESPLQQFCTATTVQTVMTMITFVCPSVQTCDASYCLALLSLLAITGIWQWQETKW